MPEPRPIRRALISVYDKTGIVDFARTLHTEFGIEIISTGGTATTLREAGVPVTLIEDITGFPELLGGRVKTLHPKIHAAILADRDNAEHMRQLAEHGIEPIDMVVVNLYPFEKTVADPNCTFEQAIEMIDIGGVTLLRAAAKNHKHVVVVADIASYDVVLARLRDGSSKAQPVRDSEPVEVLYLEGCGVGSLAAILATARYDGSIAEWLSSTFTSNHSPVVRFREFIHQGWLRYGENPHSRAELIQNRDGDGYDLDLTVADALWCDSQPKLSYNNYLDADAALGLCAELTRAGDRNKMWYRLPAGSDLVSPASSRSSNGLEARKTGGNRLEGDTTTGSSEQQPSPADKPKPLGVVDQTLSHRYLPHIQSPGRTYFVTFRTAGVELPEQARDLVLSACHHWHGRKMNLHIAVVMPDHVHLLMTPFLYSDGSAIPLAELMHSIKSYSSNQVNRALNRSGGLWMQERFDRIMRDQTEFLETWDYIETNPGRANLGEGYRWTWKSTAEFEEAGYFEDEKVRHRLEAGETCTDRLEANTTFKRLHACCFIKHTNPCGVGVSDASIEAYRLAYLGDPNAAMGGILACNFAVDAAFAENVMETYDRLGKPLKQAGAKNAPGGFFVEVWIAPRFSDDAVKIIRERKKWGESVRLLAVDDMSRAPDPSELVYRSIAGGMLVQSPDLLGLNEEQWKVVTKGAPSEREMDDLRLAWLTCKHTKSNAITIVKDGMLLGNGAGQMSRVMSCRVALWLAQENGHIPEDRKAQSRVDGPVAASDAFFPFRDGPDLLMNAGVTAIIQPGGSKRDAEVIAACDERGVAMIFTGTRHFRH